MNSKKWNENETKFLKENYPTKGLDYCCDNLKRTKCSIRKRLHLLGIRQDNYLKNSRYNINEFSKAVRESKSFTDVARKINLNPLCGNRNTIKNYIEKYKLDISHFDFGLSNIHNPIIGRRDLSDILVEKSTYFHNCNLKERLYKEGLKKRECELCGQGEEWKGKKISLILDHENGIHNDNRLNNLRIVCPNCNASLETNGGKNINQKHKTKRKEKIKKTFIRKRKVENRPPVEQLLKEIKETNYSAVGRKYGVSDNSIRKWIK